MPPLFSALCQRDLDSSMAYCTLPVAALNGQLGAWTCADFLGHVMRLAEHLPAQGFAINLCENRYLFTLAFCAAIVKRQTTLLPQNRAEATQSCLLAEYPDAYILHDGAAPIVAKSPQLNINSLVLIGEPCRDIPTIDDAFLAAIAFTSGSTGQPKANPKPWRTLVASSQINARFMLAADQPQPNVLATVPAQHMWGLETSVLLALFTPLCIMDAKPLFPQDIGNALKALKAPRMLISTPVHLRALVLSGVSMVPVERILCATAPLPLPLASAVEALFHGVLIEIFGCSEVGSMAWRRTAKQQEWHLFEGLEFEALAAGLSDVSVTGQHLPCSQVLSDNIEWVGERSFRLLGRSDDMIEIAGKKGSLQEINKILLAAPGVTDGVVFLEEDGTSSDKISRPAALVVAQGVTKEMLLSYFAKHLDPVFIPRPLLWVDHLPREENGKLPHSKLLAFFQQRRRSHNGPADATKEE